MDIRFEHHEPTTQGGFTFVGYNALTGDLSMWENSIGSKLRDAGHGTLFWNLRGQDGTPASETQHLGLDCVVEDAMTLLNHIRPAKPIHVGLSIGGLFACHTLLQGASSSGLVLLNTLRKPGPRLEWINAAVETALTAGGPAVLRDLFTPLLYGEKWLTENRATALTGDDWDGLDAKSPVVRLLHDSRSADWDVPYEKLTTPVLSVTGKRDCVFRVDDDIAELSARINQISSRTLAEVGHLIPVEAPAQLAMLLLEFADAID